jgi:hypothetical protein
VYGHWLQYVTLPHSHSAAATPAPLLLLTLAQTLDLNKKFWEELIAYFPLYDTGHTQNDASNSSIVACVFVTAVTFLPSRCLAAIGGFLPSCCLATIGDIQTDTQAVEMGSGAVIYVPSCIKIGSDIQKLIGAIHTQRQTVR